MQLLPARYYKLQFLGNHGGGAVAVGGLHFFDTLQGSNPSALMSRVPSAIRGGGPPAHHTKMDGRIATLAEALTLAKGEREGSKGEPNRLPASIMVLNRSWIGPGGAAAVTLTPVRPHNQSTPTGMQGMEPAATSPDAWPFILAHAQSMADPVTSVAGMPNECADKVRVASAQCRPEESPATVQLVWAAVTNDLYLMMAAMKSGGDVNGRTVYGFTPLHLAVQCGFEHAVSALLKKGADPNAVSDYGSCPVHEATWQAVRPVLLLLLKAGADPNRTVVETHRRYIRGDCIGHTALHLAAIRGAYGCIGPLVQVEKRSCHCLHLGNHLLKQQAFLMMQYGGDLARPRPSDGRGAVAVATWEGHFEVLEQMHAHAPARALPHTNQALTRPPPPQPSPDTPSACPPPPARSEVTSAVAGHRSASGTSTRRAACCSTPP